MEIFGLLSFLYLSSFIANKTKEDHYKKAKEEWKQKCLIDDNCHFVGIVPGLCEICGKQAKVKWKNGQAISWKW